MYKSVSVILSCFLGMSYSFRMPYASARAILRMAKHEFLHITLLGDISSSLVYSSGSFGYLCIFSILMILNYILDILRKGICSLLQWWRLKNCLAPTAAGFYGFKKTLSSPLHLTQISLSYRITIWYCRHHMRMTFVPCTFLPSKTFSLTLKAALEMVQKLVDNKNYENILFREAQLL